MKRLRLLAVAISALLAASVFARFVIPGKYRALFLKAGKDQGVDPNLLHALQLTENPAQDPLAIGAPNKDGTRDYGLMQINSSNFARLGLGDLRSNAWQDPALNIAAAAKLLALQKSSAPALKVSDHLSVYNAGFSSDTSTGLRPKLTSDGGYVDADYVRRGWTWYAWITFAAVLPFKTLGWEA